MRRALIACSLLLLATAAAAQQQQQRRLVPLDRFAAEIPRLEEELQGRASALRRDAFIVSQLVAASGELTDFQKNAAIEKAIDRVNQARKRATDKPVAPQPTLELLDSILDDLRQARQRGGFDPQQLRTHLLERTHFMQFELFTGLDLLRRDRQVITDIQARLGRLSVDVDGALAEALGSTFEFFKAGGK